MIQLIEHDSVSSFLRAGPKSGPRIAPVDIETFPMEGYHWRMWKQNIGPVQVKEDISLMSFCFKWLEQPDILYMDMRDMGKRMRNDRKLLCALHRLLDNVDFIVAQNGKRFDLPTIKGRMAIQGLSPIKPVKVIDTMVHNKNEFAFSSNSLAFLSPKFSDNPKTEHSAFPGFHQWRECLEDNPLAWDSNKEYNITDVTSTEEMYLKLRAWYNGHPNLGPFIAAEEGEHVCDKCGSTNVKKDGVRHTQVGTYQAYKCRDCGGYSRGRNLVRDAAQRAHILMS